MAKNVVAPSHEILEAALQGLEAQRTKLDEQIANVRALLGRKGKKPAKAAFSSIIPTSAPVTASKRILSPDARKRIAAAQKKRWAAFRRNQK